MMMMMIWKGTLRLAIGTGSEFSLHVLVSLWLDIVNLVYHSLVVGGWVSKSSRRACGH